MKNEKCIKLWLIVPECEKSLSATADGLKIDIIDGVLSAELFYDFNEKPLTLKADVKPNDEVNFIILDYRIELWVGDYLADEEWPCGNALFFPEKEISGDIEVKVKEEEYKKKELPSVIASFKNAEGWRPDKNIFVGDCMPFSYNGEYHVIYLKDRHHHKSKWCLGAHQWEHISTKDFETWYIHPTMVEVDKQIEGSICTGSWVMKDGVHYLFYTIRMADKSPAQIRRSFSTDGYHYQKDEDFAFTLSSKYHQTSARDPKVVFGDDGLYHMFVTTTNMENKEGCLAHLTSADFENWTEEPEPIISIGEKDQPECPDYIKFGKYYYLICSHHGAGRYLYSEKPFSDWKTPKNSIIPCKKVPKCAVWGDKIVFTGFEKIGDYAGTLTFKYASVDEDGELVFEQ